MCFCVNGIVYFILSCKLLATRITFLGEIQADDKHAPLFFSSPWKSYFCSLNQIGNHGLRGFVRQLARNKEQKIIGDTESLKKLQACGQKSPIPSRRLYLVGSKCQRQPFSE